MPEPPREGPSSWFFDEAAQVWRRSGDPQLRRLIIDTSGRRTSGADVPLRRPDVALPDEVAAFVEQRPEVVAKVAADVMRVLDQYRTNRDPVRIDERQAWRRTWLARYGKTVDGDTPQVGAIVGGTGPDVASAAEPERPLSASERFMALLGKPAPDPMTDEERAAYEAKMDAADADLRGAIARRSRPAA